MKLLASECIVLKQQPFKERDRLVTFLARDEGRLTGIARGAQKLTARGVGSYEPLSRGVIHYTRKAGVELVGIRKLDPVPPYLFLQADYEKFLYASYMAELVSLCPIAAAEAEEFFALLAGALERLYAAADPPAAALSRLDFELGFLDCLGLQPDWGRCCACGDALLTEAGGRPAPVHAAPLAFDRSDGGLRCPRCGPGRAGDGVLSPGTRAFLAQWRRPQRPAGLRPTRLALAELERVVVGHLVHQIEREPRTLALLPDPARPAAPHAG